MAIIMEAKEQNALRMALGEAKRTFYIIAAFSSMINMLLLVSPIYMLQMYDRVLSSGNRDTLIALTAIALFLLAMMALLDIVRQRLLVRVSQRLDDKLGNRVFDTLFRSNLRRTRAASLPIRDFETIRQFVTSPGLLAFFDVPWMPFFIVLVYVFHPYLGFVATFGAIVITILALSTELVSRQLLQRAGNYASMSSIFAETSLKNADVMQAMGMLGNLQKRWRTMRDPSIAMHANASERLSVLLGISKSFRYSLQVAILCVGAFLVLEQQLTPGAMIAGSIIMGRALAPVEQAISGWRTFVASRGAYIRLSTLLRDSDEPEEQLNLPQPKGEVVVQSMLGGPPGQPPIIKGAQFEIKAGEMIGIIGPSAAGKTTLGRLIIGVWPTISGHARLDGADTGQLSPHDRGMYVGYLPQDIELFSGTVADNIARFEPNFAPKDVILATQTAGCHEMILRLPKGYLTQIGEQGNMLSGGQRQRIGLARALYKFPKLLVLDEPNSNLDPEGNQALVAALMAMKKRGATQIVIAHNLDVLFSADRILVLRNGHTEAYGPAREILDKYLKRRQAG